MKKTTVIPRLDQEDRIAELIGILQNTERELQELTGGELDAVSAGDGKPMLLREAQEKLRASEATQRQVAQTLSVETRRLHESQAVANVGSWETDLVTLEITWTQETYRIFEVNPENFQPTYQRFLEMVHPDDLAKLDAAFINSQIRPEVFTVVHRICLPGGRIKHVEERWQTFNDASGKPVRAVGTCQDITERKLAEEAIRHQAHELAETGQTLTAVTEALAAYVERGDWKAAMGRLVRCALEKTQSEYGFIGVVVGSTLRVLAHEGIVWDKVINRDFYEQALRNYEKVGYLEFTSFNNLFGRAITTGKVVIANMPDADPRSSGRPSGHPPMSSFLGVPIFVGDQVQGMVALANRPGGYSEAEQHHIETLIQHAGGLCTSYRQREAAIVLEEERLKAEAAVRASESKFRQLAESNVLGIISWDAQGNISDANDAFLQMVGYTREELASGQIDWRIMTPPEYLPADERVLQEVAATGSCTPFEKEYFHKDGRRVAILIGAAALDGAKDRGMCYVVDISQQKQAEAKVREAAQFANLRAEIATQLAAPLALPDITRGVCELLVRHLDMAFARVWTLNEAEQVLELQASAGIYTHLDGPHARVPVGQFKIGRIAQNRKPHLTNDVSHDTEISDPAWAQREGMVGFAGYPLMIEGRVLGVLGMFSRHAFSEQVFGELPPLVDWITQCIQRKRDEAALSVSEKQLRLLELCVSRLNDIVLITDAEPLDEPGPRIVYVNDAFERRTGYTRDEVIGKTPRILQGPKTQRDGLDRIRKALEKWQPVREELINYTKSGEEFWLELDIVPVADETGWFTHWVAIERDITERKNASMILAESERRLRMALDAARMGTFEWNINENTRTWGGAHEAIWGYAPGEYDGSFEGFSSRVHPEDRERLGMACLSENGPTAANVRIIWPDGTLRWVSVNGEVTAHADGKPTRISGVVTDITEQNLAAIALAESENRLRLALNAGRMGTFEWNMVHNQRKWSPLHEQLWGFAPGEYDGSYEKFAERIHPEDRSIVNRVIKSCENANQTSNVEFRVVWPDGSVHWILTLGEYAFFENEKPVGMYGMVMEITERKRIEEEQRQSAESLAGIVKIQQEIASLSVPLVEVMTIMADRSQALTKSSGAVVELADGDEMVYRAAAGCMKDKIGTRIKREGSLSGLAFKTGSVLSCDDTEEDPRVDLPSCRRMGVRAMIVAPLRVGNEVIGVLKTMSSRPDFFTARDISNIQILVETLGVVIQRQQASEQLKKSEEQYRLLFSNNPHPMWAYDLETLRFLAVNEAAVQQYGYTAEEFFEMTLRDIRPAEETSRFEATLNTLSHQGKNSGIWKHQKKDGSIIQVEVSSDGVVFEGRNARLVLAHDVTERERAAEAIASSEREFRNLAESMPQIVWVADPDGSNTYINQNWIDYTGLTIEESLGLGWTESYHPEDREIGWKIWREAMKTGATYTIESRLRGADGEYRWWLIRGEAQRDAHGEVVKWFGTCTDIHDLKVADLEISRTNRALKMLSSCNEALIHARDEKTLLEKVCQIAHEVGGYRLAWVGYAMDDAAKSIQPIAFYGSEEGYLSKVNVSWNENEIQGRGPAGRTICSGKPVICEDTLTDPEFTAWQSIAKEHHFRSIVSLPLRDEIHTFGLLVLYSEVVNEASDEEVRLLQEMADDLAFGIGHLRSKLERDRVQAAMLTVASGVSASTGEEFFQQLAASMCEALGAKAAFVAEISAEKPTLAKTLAGVLDGQAVDSFEYELEGTPCLPLLTSDECIIRKNVTQEFPNSARLQNLNAEAYVGRRLTDTSGKKIGLIFVLFREPLDEANFITATLQIFAARASAELQRKRADAHVREQAALLDAAHEAIIVKDIDGHITYWNKGAERTYGWTAEEVINRDAGEFLYDDFAAFKKAREVLLEKGAWDGELVKLNKSGGKLDVEVRWTLVLDEKGNPKSILAINNDVTEKKKLEKQFLRAQRLESIGTLASGIAHDLNNTLAPILMAVEVLGYNMKDPNDLSLLATVEASAQHGAELVQQVLAFGRGVEGQRILVNPVHLLNDIHKMIRDTFPKNIDFRFSPAADLWTVNGDPTQLHQVFTNLCVNARDAMPQGGTISVSMKNWIIDDVYAGMNPESKEGSYVMVQVSDSGTGIPPEIREKIFDPFFTTKEIGKGTGLGLSTVMAIIKSHGGFIDLYSEPGKGTQFKVYIPANTTEQEVEVAEVKQTRLPMGNGEIVLIVDDEERIRFITEKTLRRFGYQTMTAAHGAEAIAIYAERKNEIAVVLTDMAMPVMDGPATIIALLAMNPKVKIIGSSGLQSNDGIAKAIGAGIKYFVPKPYTAETMLKVLAEIIADK